MPLINTFTPENAEGQVKEIYNQIESAFGSVPNALQMYSSSPALLARQWQQIGYYMQHPTLGFNLLAMIRMLVSEEGNCDYCVGLNAGLLINMGGLTIDQVTAMKENPQNAPLSDKDKAMLLFVLKATHAASTVNQSDIANLKTLGWNDGEILDGLTQGAYMQAADTIFNALKIENDF